MDTTSQQKQELFHILQKCKAYLDENPNIVPDHLYSVLEAVSAMFYKWKHSHGKTKWSRSLKSPSLMSLAETSFQKAGPYLAYNQLGGEWNTSFRQASEQNPLRKSYRRVEEYLERVNTQWNEISNALGVVAPENRQIRTRAIEFVVMLIEMLSLWIQTTPLTTENYRFFHSLCSFLCEAVQGNTEKAILESLELFSNPEIFLSQAGGFFLDVLRLVQPDRADEFLQAENESVKRISAFFLLWCFSSFAPSSVQATIPINIKEISIDEFKCSSQNETILPTLARITSLKLALDLLDIPTTSREFQEDCKSGGKTRKASRHSKRTTRRKH